MLRTNATNSSRSGPDSTWESQGNRRQSMDDDDEVDDEEFWGPPAWLRWQYTLKRNIRAMTIWQWIIFIALSLVLFRFLRPVHNAASEKASRQHDLPKTILSEEPSDGIDWSRFAYTQYVTDMEYLCNSLMMFESLHRLGSKADRLLLYPAQWELSPKKPTYISKFLRKAQVDYKVHIIPIRALHFDDGEGTWAESFTKLLAFRQTQYERVLSLDSDGTILKPLDELFLLPSTPVAVPEAYWIGKESVSSAIMLIEPSMDEFKRVMAAMKNRVSDEFDMDLVNDLYAGSATILPKENWVVTGEFRRKQHDSYLPAGETWDAEKIMNTTKYVHFSDWPFPKPWFEAEHEMKAATKPKCVELPDGKQDCKDRNAWVWLYKDFQKRREDICGVPFTNYLTDVDMEHMEIF